MKAALFMMGLAVLTAWGQEDAPLTRLYDTGGQRRDAAATWKLVPEEQTNHTFTGDAVLVNDKLAVFFGKDALGPEVFSKTASGLQYRATLGYAAGGLRGGGKPAGTPVLRGQTAALKILENTSGGVMLDASYQEGGASPIRFRLTTGEAILEIRATDSAGFVEVRTQTRYVVVPDYFGDDLVYELPVSRNLALPAENLMLNLLEDGQAMVMTVWQSRAQEAWVLAGGDAGSTKVGKSGQGGASVHRIRCLKDKSIWCAFLESPGIWQTVQPPLKPDWKPPFPAKWRGNRISAQGVSDSWELEREPGPAQLQGAAAKPFLIYPLDRSAATPLTTVCPTDIMRNTLGVGPCQYILACEGMAAQGDPTPNSVMNWVEKQFEQKKDRKVADDIRERLEVMVRHVGEARGRIEGYAEFAGQLRKRLGTGADASGYPAILNDLDRFIAAGRAPVATSEQARQCAAAVSALIGKENSVADCKRLGAELRAIGAIQDGALARCRMAVRRLRQEGRGVTDDASPADPLTQEIQRLTEQILNTK
ncbi:MAG: hypothetical protein WCO56_20260 [Verrucomicrobiota bacterium]